MQTHLLSFKGRKDEENKTRNPSPQCVPRRLMASQVCGPRISEVTLLVIIRNIYYSTWTSEILFKGTVSFLCLKHNYGAKDRLWFIFFYDSFMYVLLLCSHTNRSDRTTWRELSIFRSLSFSPLLYSKGYLFCV